MTAFFNRHIRVMSKRRKHSAVNSVLPNVTGTATGTEITLCCLVHGEPSSSYFLVTVGNDKDVHDLRVLIKKKSEPYFDDLASWQLELWVVSIPLNSPNLGDSSVDIANVLRGTEFPPNTIGDIFTGQPIKNHIHIIIESPTSHAPVGK